MSHTYPKKADNPSSFTSFTIFVFGFFTFKVCDNLGIVSKIFSISLNGLEFNSTDDLPVDIIFLLIAPDNKGSEHLQALALISRLLRNKELTTKLRGCKSAESALAVITQSIREEAA